MRVVFMGTPDFAVNTLEAVIKAGHEVVMVVTQPDKKKGRGKTMQFTPVKEVAVRENIPVLQPVKVREDAVLEQLKEAAPDVIVVVAYGQILPEDILKLPEYGCINVHASLLPKYRGAAPIQWAVINGESESGVTTMYMAKGLDTGDMIDKVVVPLLPEETGGSLHDKLAEAGAGLLVETLAKLEAGTATRTPQDDSKSSYASMLSKALGNIDWTKPAVEIERLIRGLSPWPSAFTYLNGKTLKLWSTKVLKEAELPQGSLIGEHAGEIVYVDKNSFIVRAGEDYINVLELQLEGKKRMETDAFLRGYALQAGCVLSRER
ncbi:MAG: methionyl-tRNA formyltransferase [Lachnospira sp.]|nr:methionyl-tRNA formyltransferase [Lachnospira sp.]